MALKTILGALAITGVVITSTGCPDNKGGAGAAGATGAAGAATGAAGAAGTAESAAAAAGSAGASAAGAATAGAMSDDDKHKLYQAAAMSGDSAMIMMVNKKIGIMKDDGMPTDAMTKFTQEHGAWAQNNVSFLQTMNSPEKAKEYVNSHK